MNIISDCAIFKRYESQFPEDNLNITVACISSDEPYLNAFTSIGHTIFYDPYLAEQFNLSEQEQFACIAHEIGHIIDETPREGSNNEETYLMRCLREFNADLYVSGLKLHKALISALSKMCQDDLLTQMRIKVLEKSQTTKPLRPDSLLFPLLLSNNYGFDKWDLRNHPYADMILYKEGNPWYFEIKCTTTDKNIFGAGTLTEWKCVTENVGRYFFVIVKMEPLKTLPKFIIYTPQELIKYSTVPPFKINFNIREVKSINSSVQEQLSNAIKEEDVLPWQKWENPKANNHKAVYCTGKTIESMIQYYYCCLKTT